MPGTLPLHQTTDDLLASSSDSLSSTHAVTGSSGRSSSGSGGSKQREGSSFATKGSAKQEVADDLSSGNTIRMGEMLETQSQVVPAVHHHHSSGRKQLR